MAAIQPPTCPTHGVDGVLVDDAVVYGRSYGWIWKCPVDGCDKRVGAHKDTRKPKGTMVGDDLRQWRIRAHAAFDGWWKRHGHKRNHAYRVLAQELGLSEAHIGEMDAAGCQRVIDLFPESR